MTHLGVGAAKIYTIYTIFWCGPDTKRGTACTDALSLVALCVPYQYMICVHGFMFTLPCAMYKSCYHCSPPATHAIPLSCPHSAPRDSPRSELVTTPDSCHTRPPPPRRRPLLLLSVMGQPWIIILWLPPSDPCHTPSCSH